MRSSAVRFIEGPLGAVRVPAARVVGTLGTTASDGGHAACARCGCVHRVTRSSRSESGVIVVVYDEACPCGCRASGEDYDRAVAGSSVA